MANLLVRPIKFRDRYPLSAILQSFILFLVYNSGLRNNTPTRIIFQLKINTQTIEAYSRYQF